MPHGLSARRIVASAFGVYAGFLAVEHGLFETMQGNTSINQPLINAIAPSASNLWHGGEPALTVLPTFLTTGILAIAIGLTVAVWSAIFIRRRRAAGVLAALLLAQLLVGGGLAPLFVGIWAVVVGALMNSPLNLLKIKLPLKTASVFGKALPWFSATFFVLSTIDLVLAVLAYNPALLNLLAPIVAFVLPLLVVISTLIRDVYSQRVKLAGGRKL